MENVIESWNITKVPYKELMQRQTNLRKKLEEENCSGMLFFQAAAQRYLTGGNFIDTERPFVLILKTDGSSAMLVPFLEAEHVPQVVAGVDRIVSYPEFPGEKHPMEYLAQLLEEMNLSREAVAADSDGYGAHFGYSGPKISAVCPNLKLKLMPRLIEKFKTIKSEYDISVIKESARWGNFAHALLQEYTHIGLKEVDVEQRVTAEATRAALLTLGPDFIPGTDFLIGADYRGQIGKNTYYPHALVNNVTFKRGDILGTRARGNMLGYNSELERCMFVGEPSQENCTFYNHIIAMQNLAFSIIKPGVKCSDVDKEVMRYYKENGLMPYWRHHTGHGLGLGKHEAPFFDCYDDTVLQEGMLFSVEPGLYVKDVGGFRLSDTVLVTKTGAQLITYYPRDIQSVIVE
ncbi:MAG: Xaa-Pro peptidase family protein [Oscillospiraceae bacterium]